MDVQDILIGEIEVPPGHRALDEIIVARLIQSFDRLGQLNPIYVLPDCTLVAGGHRLAAAKALGWKSIKAVAYDADAASARAVTISENLDRSELSLIERSEQIAEWANIVTARLLKDSYGPTGPITPNRPKDLASNRSVAEEMGVARKVVDRARKITALPEEAKALARKLGLAENRDALLGAASDPNPEAFLWKFAGANAKDKELTPEEDRLEAAEQAFVAWQDARDGLRPEEVKEHDRRIWRRLLDGGMIYRRKPTHISFDNAADLLEDLGSEDMAPSPVRHVMKDGVLL